MVTTKVIVIAAAAIVFAVLVIVLVNMWKRETERRTASIKAIEKRLNDVVSQLVDSNRLISETNNGSIDKRLDSLLEILQQMKSDDRDIASEDFSELEAYDTEMPEDEISFDFLDSYDFDDMDDDSFEEDYGGLPNEYITGRSGKKYTAEELESLIKE